MGMIEDGLAGDDGTVQPGAAFLAGRSDTGEPTDDAWFTQLLHEFIGTLDPGNLRSASPAYAEAAMSLGLLGETDTARRLLLPLVAGDGTQSTRGYLAAFYLAQLGDPSGYPVMVTALHDDSQHTRLMATRYLIAFVPYDGVDIGGLTVDVRARLLERQDDPDPYVNREVPGLLEEAQLSAGA